MNFGDPPSHVSRTTLALGAKLSTGRYHNLFSDFSEAFHLYSRRHRRLMNHDPDVRHPSVCNHQLAPQSVIPKALSSRPLHGEMVRRLHCFPQSQDPSAVSPKAKRGSGSARFSSLSYHCYLQRLYEDTCSHYLRFPT